MTDAVVRTLHVVGTDADGALLLAEEPGGPVRYRVPDARVVPRPKERAVRRPPSPAQIQARLRRGEEPAAIARATGADVERVLRWAAPVQAEMADVLRRARAAPVSDGEQRTARDLDGLVAAALGEGEHDVTWQTTRRADGRWRVLVGITDAGRRSTASWVWDPRTRQLSAASARARRISFPPERDAAAT